MSYIDNNLLDDEKVVYRAHLSHIIFGGALFWIILAIFLYFILYEKGFDQIFIPYAPSVSLLAIILVVPIIFAIWTWIAAYVRYISADFAVTNRRVMIKLGLIRRYTYENFLQKVESIQVIQSVLGRIFNYGTLVIHGTGGSREVYALLHDPLKFKRNAEEQISESMK